MTPSRLQDCLVADLKEQLKEFLLKNAKNEMVNLNIYPQNLPAKKSSKDSDHFPFVVVRVNDGEMQEAPDEENGEKSTCKIQFVIGAYDDSDNYQGYKDVMNLIEKIIQRLKRKRYYDNVFELTLPLTWMVHDEDTFPYYYGGIETNWNMPQICMDDSLI